MKKQYRIKEEIYNNGFKYYYIQEYHKWWGWRYSTDCDGDKISHSTLKECTDLIEYWEKGSKIKEINYIDVK
jgi:hypothetical protein